MKQQQSNNEKDSRLLKMAAELGITFIDLKRDFAFKWAFGTPGHEDLLLLLLKGLLPEKHIKSVQLGPQDQKPDREDEDENSQFTDSIHYITVELPKFNKTTSQLSSFQDYVLYSIKNMGVMKVMPKEFSGKGLDKFFETCMFVHMNEDLQMKYVRQMMAEWDRESQLATAIMHGEAKGREEGREEKRSEIAKAMKAEGLSTDVIAKCTGMTPQQIDML